MTYQELVTRIEAAPKVDFGSILSRSFDLFKTLWVEALKHGLLSLIIVLPFIVLVYAPILPFYVDLIQNEGNMQYVDPPFNYSGPWLVGYIVIVFVLSILLQVVTYAITARFFNVCKLKEAEDSTAAGPYLALLKTHGVKLFVLSLAMIGIALLAALLCYLPIFYVMVPMQLIIPLFAFNTELSVSEIIKLAFKLGNKYWLILFGLIIVASLLSQLGILLCGVGLFVTAYFVYLPIYYFYKDTIGFE